MTPPARRNIEAIALAIATSAPLLVSLDRWDHALVSGACGAAAWRLWSRPWAWSAALASAALPLPALAGDHLMWYASVPAVVSALPEEARWVRLTAAAAMAVFLVWLLHGTWVAAAMAVSCAMAGLSWVVRVEPTRATMVGWIRAAIIAVTLFVGALAIADVSLPPWAILATGLGVAAQALALIVAARSRDVAAAAWLGLVAAAFAATAAAVALDLPWRSPAALALILAFVQVPAAFALLVGPSPRGSKVAA